MSSKQDQVKYADCMTFIRYRLEVVDKFLSQRVTTGYEIPDLETICLQFRKVFELIAMSSLCANREKCYEVQQRFDKMWKASDIIKFVETLNPHFYPVPINRTFNDDTATGMITHISDGFLTRDDLVEAHGKCGNLLHADNPYRSQDSSVDEWRKNFGEWYQKTRILLKLHTTQLIDQDTQWWIVMRFGTNQPVQVAVMQAIAKNND